MLSVFQHYTTETGNLLSSSGFGMYKVLSRTLPLSAAFILMIDIIFKVKNGYQCIRGAERRLNWKGWVVVQGE